MTTRAGALSRWWTFSAERYEPVSHLAMAAAFAAGNVGVALADRGADPIALPLLGSALLAVLFFFRLRVYDEIKDFDTDRLHNPGRPLARGLISIVEARRAAWGLAAAEVAVVLAVAPPAALAWLLALAYSLAMFREFGIGAWLRPRMELYATSHTLVAAALGVTVACMALDAGPLGLPGRVYLFMAANWALFNVFEFSRKSFATAEERAGVESYSSRWGTSGATAITLSWAALALGAVGLGRIGSLPLVGQGPGLILFGALALVLAAPYALRPRPGTARWFRGAMSAWAALLYVALGVTHLAVP